MTCAEKFEVERTTATVWATYSKRKEQGEAQRSEVKNGEGSPFAID
jgi:hypothetical protein